MQRNPADATASSADSRRTLLRAAAPNLVAAALFAAPFVVTDFLGVSRTVVPARVIAATTTVALLLLVRGLCRRASPRALGLAVSLLLGPLFVLELYTARYYGTHLDRQLLASAVVNARDVLPVVYRSLPIYVPLALGAAAFFYGAVRWPAAPAPVVDMRALRYAASFAVVLALSCLLPATPRSVIADVTLALGAVGERTATVRGSGARVPELVSRRSDLPNVLFVLTESIRAKSYCQTGTCSTAPKTSARFPERTTLAGMRSVASYTAVSFAALTSGQPQGGRLEELAQMPTLFDLVTHIHRGSDRVHAAYFSAQSRSIFVRDDLDQGLDDAVTLETLVGTKVEDEDDFVDRGVDRLVTREGIRRLGKLQEPYLAFVHLAGTHAPYFVDPNMAPFRPYVRYAAWSELPALERAYHDAMVAQDDALDSLVREFESAQHGRPYVVVFTSDHGEAFGEHGAIHHGQNLYDEQIHVPAWLYASPGAIDDAQRTSLGDWSGRLTTHLDLLPSLLDLYGVWDDPALVDLRRALPGRSLFRSPTPLPAPVVITNCTAQFKCPVTTFGLLGDTREITAQPWDAKWHCVDVATGSEDLAPADPACMALTHASGGFFPVLPNGAPNVE